MEVIKITPRGYCYGVVDAIQLALQMTKDPTVPRPIYVLGQIVHNRHLVEKLEQQGIATLDGEDRLALLDSITEGTVIFTAHGVSPAVKVKAKRKGLYCVDATCPDVTKTHDLVRELAAQGYEIVYIGKRRHPEPEGVIGEAPDRVHLVENSEDVAALHLQVDKTLRVDKSRARDKIAVTTQTTLSKWDTERLIELIKEKYPQVEVYNEICLATQQRQEAAVRQSKDADLVIVVGDIRSNNSNRLVQVVREMAGKPAYLVDSMKDIHLEWLKGAKKVAVTSGSSTPSDITREVIRFLEGLDLDVADQPVVVKSS